MLPRFIHAWCFSTRDTIKTVPAQGKRKYSKKPINNEILRRPEVNLARRADFLRAG
jgi:hypothetical protein